MAHDPGDTDLPVDLGVDLVGHDPLPTIHATPVVGLELDAQDGPHALEAPTVDSDADGIADTTVTADPAIGPAVLGLATDLDGDAHVDILTTIDAAGTAHTITFPAGPPGPPGPPEPPPSWDEGVPPPPPVLDPASGRWTRLAD